MQFERLKEHRRTEKLEELLKEVNGLFGPVEDRAIESFKKNKYPVVLIMGSPRSGTTLLLQWLASLGCFCYPTNILSRFYGAPYVGAKIQLMLTKYDFNNEIFDFNEEVPFTSKLGKTRGALAPNEFWYFWRRFFNYGEIQYLNEDELKDVNSKKFVAELAAIESVFERPLAMKALIVNWNIQYMASLFDRALFIYVKRHPLYNVQSLLEARTSYFGDRKLWYSFKPKEYDMLKGLDPFSQVAGQVYFTNKAIEQGLKEIDPSRWVQVNYEEFCENPKKIFSQIVNKLKEQDCAIESGYTGTERFQSTNQIRLSEEECQKIINGYKNFSGIELKK